MIYDYEFIILEHPTLTEQLAARSDAGWRLVTAFAHPTATVDEQPQIISIWERERP